MELLLISEKKMKIMLSKEDMDAYGLDSENLDYNIAATRDSLDRIFEIAKIKTGFQTGNGRMFVQAYPALSGGCEIFITVLDGNAPCLLSEGRGRNIYSVFKDEQTLKQAAEYIKNNGSIRDMSVYKDRYTGRSFLLAELEKDISKDEEGYLLAYFHEIGALGSALISRNEFSKERYEK